MAGLTDLGRLLAELDPVLDAPEYVFCTFPGRVYGDLGHLKPVAMVREAEGLTLVLEHAIAARAGLPCEMLFREIVLGVHSSLLAVGLTAAASGALALRGISANIVAGCYHDHIFVPAHLAQAALEALRELG